MAQDHGYVYAGLGGDTGAGYVALAGLFRSAGGDGAWERIDAAIDPKPEARTIAVDKRRPGRVLIGSQAGVWRSDDHGTTWRQTKAPKPELAVWSLAVHPHNPDIVFAGYEPCAIHRSDDGGETWRALPVSVTFPEITLKPAPQVKRVIDIAVDPSRPDDIYAAIEVGGVIRSRDGGETWRNVTDGLYVTDDALDLHRIVVSPAHAGVVSTIGRIGMFRSRDAGEHWGTLAVPPSATGKRPYCRELVVAPDDPHVLYLGLGAAFESDKGGLFRSTDFGINWWPIDLGAPVRNTVFAVAIDEARPDHIYCGIKSGEVFWSRDGGTSWAVNPLPQGARQLYALAAG
jgi:photosystem II stability/assembly factor-like uncharacterized protein